MNTMKVTEVVQDLTHMPSKMTVPETVQKIVSKVHTNSLLISAQFFRKVATHLRLAEQS